jgi:Fe-S-cluster containining protein
MMDFGPFFERYRSLVRQVDAVFTKVQQEFAACVHCKVGCSDCCHALFDLSLIEALYIKAQFDAMFKNEARTLVLERADAADREIYRLKRRAFKAHEQGRSEDQILEEIAEQRVRCPLLNAQDQCDLYRHRPITCRLYGIPTAIGGKAHTCGMSGFERGRSYPTVKLDDIHRSLYDLSAQLAQQIGSRYPKLGELLVPVSMALLTDYSEAYLGVQANQNPDEEKVD